MDIILFTLLTLVGAAFVVHPLLGRNRSNGSRGPRAGAVERDLLLAERDAIYADLKDLEFEFETGKLSESDYSELRQAYRVRALDVLERIAERVPGPENASRPRECRVCGTEFETEDQFCCICGGARSEYTPAAVS